MKTLEAKGMW